MNETLNTSELESVLLSGFETVEPVKGEEFLKPLGLDFEFMPTPEILKNENEFQSLLIQSAFGSFNEEKPHLLDAILEYRNSPLPAKSKAEVAVNIWRDQNLVDVTKRFVQDKNISIDHLTNIFARTRFVNIDSYNPILFDLASEDLKVQRLDELGLGYRFITSDISVTVRYDEIIYFLAHTLALKTFQNDISLQEEKTIKLSNILNSFGFTLCNVRNQDENTGLSKLFNAVKNDSLGSILVSLQNGENLDLLEKSRESIHGKRHGMSVIVTKIIDGKTYEIVETYEHDDCNEEAKSKMREILSIPGENISVFDTEDDLQEGYLYPGDEETVEGSVSALTLFPFHLDLYIEPREHIKRDYIPDDMGLIPRIATRRSLSKENGTKLKVTSIEKVQKISHQKTISAPSEKISDQPIKKEFNTLKSNSNKKSILHYMKAQADIKGLESTTDNQYLKHSNKQHVENQKSLHDEMIYSITKDLLVTKFNPENNFITNTPIENIEIKKITAIKTGVKLTDAFRLIDKKKTIAKDKYVTIGKFKDSTTKTISNTTKISSKTKRKIVKKNTVQGKRQISRNEKPSMKISRYEYLGLRLPVIFGIDTTNPIEVNRSIIKSILRYESNNKWKNL